MTADESFVQLTSPGRPGWIGLPLECADPLGWATQKVETDADGLAPCETSIGAKAAADDLAVAVVRAQGLWPSNISAAISMALQPDPLGPVLAVLDVALFPVSDELVNAETVITLVESRTRTVGSVEHSEVSFPVGGGDRYHYVYGEDPLHLNPDSATDAVAGLSYVIYPPKLPGLLWADASWFTLALGDAISTDVDEIVRELIVEYHP